ncbi:hypothetical protein CPAV1605_580 [seawater metagenome]|uniref:Uncharacterized protein n=1 Tax=seawater metagenome TaxID=1561972 RepID=A0A5E8CLG5_9ZZZZ
MNSKLSINILYFIVIVLIVLFGAFIYNIKSAITQNTKLNNLINKLNKKDKQQIMEWIDDRKKEFNTPKNNFSENQPYNWNICGMPNYISEEAAELVPFDAENTCQINEPLGKEKAQKLAKALGITDEIIFTADEFKCILQNSPPDDQKILITCIFNLTNTCHSNKLMVYKKYGIIDLMKKLAISKLEDAKSLASYGTSIFVEDNELYIANACYNTDEFKRNCKAFNELILGSLEKTTASCGELVKFLKMFLFGLRENLQGASCQDDAGGACVASLTYKDTQDTKYYGVPITPVIWTANFILIYCICPELGELMPAYIQPFPEDVANELQNNGKLKYSDWIDKFETC